MGEGEGRGGGGGDGLIRGGLETVSIVGLVTFWRTGGFQMYEMFSCDSKRSSNLMVVEMISKESSLALRHMEVRSGRTIE